MPDYFAGYTYRPQFAHRPSTFFWMGDCYSKLYNAAWYYMGFSTADNVAYAAHNNRMNVLWADGHADTNGQGDLSKKVYETCNVLLTTMEVVVF